MTVMDEIKARPTVYRGIQMRSRLEARFAAGLDDLGWEWQYEPQCFADGRDQYLPDFHVEGSLAIVVDSFAQVDGQWFDVPGRVVSTVERFYVEVRPPTARATLDISKHVRTIRANEKGAVYLRWVCVDGFEPIDGTAILDDPSAPFVSLCTVDSNPPSLRVISTREVHRDGP